MNIVLLFSFLLSIIPIILIGYYFFKKDTIKEPKKLLGSLFISGIFSGIIVIIISILSLIFFPILNNDLKINNLFILLFYSFIFIAFIEECSKLLMIYKLGYNNKEFDQAFDIILYSVFIALGFATFENILYLISNQSLEAAVLRGVTAVPAHTCFQTMMGYYLYQSKLKDKNKNILLGLLVAILLHGTYDFLIFTGSIILVVFDFIFLIFMFYLASKKIKELIKIDKKNIKPYCPYCGSKINYEFCPNCGSKKQ